MKTILVLVVFLLGMLFQSWRQGRKEKRGYTEIKSWKQRQDEDLKKLDRFRKIAHLVIFSLVLNSAIILGWDIWEYRQQRGKIVEARYTEKVIWFYGLTSFEAKLHREGKLKYRGG